MPGMGPCRGCSRVGDGIPQGAQGPSRVTPGLCQRRLQRSGYLRKGQFWFQSCRQTSQAAPKSKLFFTQGPALLQLSAQPGPWWVGGLCRCCMGTERSPMPFLGIPGLLDGSEVIAP